MTIDPRQLLRRLEPAVRPTGTGSARGRVSAADGGFTELLSLARDGAIESAREPEMADGATLEPATMAQVARALDLAQGRGARRAVIVAEDAARAAERDRRIAVLRAAVDADTAACRARHGHIGDPR